MKPVTPIGVGSWDQWAENARLYQKWLDEEREIYQPSISSLPTVKEVFEGTSIFLTGGTGFIGKIIIEKILRSLPGVDKIYVLIRGKKEKSPEERLAETLSFPIFDQIRQQNPGCISKVVAVKGDISDIRLGLNDLDFEVLCNEVAFVYHSAATVRFNHEFKSAVIINVRGTREVIELSKKMKKLRAFVHLSTCFVNSHLYDSEERVYPALYDWRILIKIAETNAVGDLEALLPKIKRHFENTYLFTKQLAEKIVDDAKNEIPVAIARPCVVSNCVEEPIPGWSDNLYGPFLLGIGMLKGFVRVLLGDPNILVKTIPVDVCVKCLLVLSWVRATGQTLRTTNTDVDVINMSGTDIYSPTLQFLIDFFRENAETLPISAIRKPRLAITTNKLYFWYKTYTSHLLFGAVLDTALRLTGRKPMLMSNVRKLLLNNLMLAKQGTKPCKFHTDNFLRILIYVKNDDLKDFGVNVCVPYKQMTFETIKGSCTYVLKEDMNREALRRMHFRLNVIDGIMHVLKILGFVFVSWYLLKFLGIF